MLTGILPPTQFYTYKINNRFETLATEHVTIEWFLPCGDSPPIVGTHCFEA